MFCITLNFRNADVSVREKYALSPEIMKEIKTGVLLNTCNRTELYAQGSPYCIVNRYFADAKQYLRIYENERAMEHLFRVACGLDSMVLGEDEILGQVKDAYRYSLENGYSDYELNMAFQAAIACAKKIKTDTLLSKSSVSVATLAASLCQKYKSGKATVLLIGGSGDIGGKVLQNLISIGGFDIYATVRAHRIKNAVHLIEYQNRYEYLQKADIVISATNSPHFTVTADKTDGKERLYLDLAVPRDIDSAIPGVITIDDLNALASENHQIKQSALETAEEMLKEQLDTLLKELYLHQIMPLNISTERKGFIYDFRDKATADEFAAFCRVIKRMEKSDDTVSLF